jgi:hypothetical protein
MHVENTSVENILHYFDTPKPQGGKPVFKMKLHIRCNTLSNSSQSSS